MPPTVSTLAGSTSGRKDGIGSQAQFKQPCGVACNAKMPDVVALADTSNHSICIVSIVTGESRTIAGNGVAGISFWFSKHDLQSNKMHHSSYTQVIRTALATKRSSIVPMA